MLGAILTTQAAVKHLGEGASIINIGSAVTDITPAHSAVYTGTKGALDAITGVLARELGPRKIRVNTINPGMVDTEGTQTAGFIGSDMEKTLLPQVPLGRTGTVGDIAPIAVFLASDEIGLADRRAARRQRRPPVRPLSHQRRPIALDNQLHIVIITAIHAQPEP